MIWRAIIAAIVVTGVSELGTRFPRLGALLLTLPFVSIVAFVALWHKTQSVETVSQLARETLILVPLGLPFFIPLAFAEQFHISFWAAFVIGILLASFTIGTWFILATKFS